MDLNDTEVDFKIHDGYVAFSSEIVRLALLSPAAFAFFIALAGKDATTETFSQLIQPGRSWLIASFTLMALAVLFGLCHRYLAIDFMYSLIRKRRQGGSMKDDWRTSASDWSIILAPLCLLLGAALLFIAVFTILGGAES